MKRCRLFVGAAFFVVFLFNMSSAHATITVGDYLSLRERAQSGEQSAINRWRYYIIGLMDGIQAVQAPSAARGAKLHFCMPSDLPISPKFLDEFLHEAMKRLSDKGELDRQLDTPMAVLVAIELKRAFPCDGS